MGNRSIQRRLDAEHVQIQPPEGELLPAEERLANVLKAIEDRLLTEVRNAHELEYRCEDDTQEYEDLRSFIGGLDIAWSLAQTESLRTSG